MTKGSLYGRPFFDWNIKVKKLREGGLKTSNTTKVDKTIEIQNRRTRIDKCASERSDKKQRNKKFKKFKVEQESKFNKRKEQKGKKNEIKDKRRIGIGSNCDLSHF